MTTIILDLSLLEGSVVVVRNDPAAEDPLLKDGVASSSSIASPKTVIPARAAPRVRFRDDSVHNRVVYEYRKEYTPEEAAGLWYTPHDLDRIRASNVAQLSARTSDIARASAPWCDSNSGSFDSPDWTWRGFDYVLRRVPRNALRRAHCQSVLRFQKTGGSSASSSSVEALAVSAVEDSESHGSQARAHRIALQDEEEARAYLERRRPGEHQQEEDEDDATASLSSVDSVESTNGDCLVVDEPVKPTSTPTKAHDRLLFPRANHPGACMNVCFVRKVSKSAW